MLLRQCTFTWGCAVEALHIYVRQCTFTWGLRFCWGVYFYEYVRQSTFSWGLNFCFWGSAYLSEVSGSFVEELHIYLRFQVNAAVTVKNIVFWDVMPCSLVEKYGVLQYVNLYQTTRCHIPQDSVFSGQWGLTEIGVCSLWRHEGEIKIP
jgi:hypothetical protein